MHIQPIIDRSVACSCAARSLAALAGCALSLAAASYASAQGTLPNRALVNFESPHVHPIDLTPGGSTLLAVNTADNRLEVFDLVGGIPVRRGSVPVGLDPVSVRALSDTQAWVVNQISDSVSIVNLQTLSVTTTLATRDEPGDVAFAGGTPGQPTKAFVSCGAANAVLVFDLTNLTAAPVTIAINGEHPRSLAVSPSGDKVYCAIFESGNQTTILGGGSTGLGTIAFPPNAVSDPLGPYGGVNPPPNDGPAFSPPRPVGAPPTIPVGLIVRKNSAGQWLDDNGTNWTSLVSGPNAARSGRPVNWDLTDNDCAVITASTNAVTYATGLMNLCMSVGVNPATGTVHVVGTEAHNEVRFEPNLNGRFVTVHDASFPAASISSVSITDLNPHLDYVSSTVSQTERDESIGDPRAIAFHPSGGFGFVAGMGSNNIVRIDALGGRPIGPGAVIEVAEGPTGLAFSASGNRLYVMSKFAARISVIDPAAGSSGLIASVPLFDPSPASIKSGRKHLYDTHNNSGLGHVSCASCHVDGKMDRLAWDLGDPSGANAPLTNRNLGFGIPFLEPGTTTTPYLPFHPMKGPMLTQTMQDIIGHEPLHWRGDRLGIEEFNGAFTGLQGDDNNLTQTEMQQFEDFLATITFPPNPKRNFDNTLPSSMPLPGHFRTGRFGAAGTPLPNGNAVNGLSIYRSATRRLDGGAFACVTCHTLPTGMGTDMTRVGNTFVPIAVGPNGERHHGLVSVDGSTNAAIKVPQLRNIYKRTGFNTTQTVNRNGFGMLHDGSVDSIERFVAEPAFNVASDQEVADLVAFMLAFSGSNLPAGSPTNVFEPPGPLSKDVPASVGQQITVSANPPPAATTTRINQMVAQANLNRVGLVVKGTLNGVQRGFVYEGGIFLSDRVGSTFTQAQLMALAGPGSELTFTVVPFGTQVRIGIDRDRDGWLDRDEVDICTDPADPASFPGGPGSADFNADLALNPDDLADYIGGYFAVPPDPRCDFNADGGVDPDDLADYIGRFFDPCG